MSNCLECARFDAETRKKLLELFGPDEILLIAMNLAAYLKQIVEVSKSDTSPKLRKMQAIQQGDAVGMTLGKLLIGLEAEARKQAVVAIEKKFGMTLNIQHEKCPHAGPRGEVV